jgi:hypothetical protein
MLYSYAKLSRLDFGIVRFGGPGLGNLLFPWARFITASHKYSLTPICPTWPQFKVGPTLRREKDKRSYYDLFIISDDQICGWRKYGLLATAPRTSESEFPRLLNSGVHARIVVFEGMGRFFEPILADHALVKESLLKISRAEHKVGMEFDFRGSISVHVRLGDFGVPSDKCDLISGKPNLRLPLSWYIASINELRRQLNKQLPVFVFSDGRDEELEALLSLPCCQRINFGSSLSDLIALSRANILIASNSTFSMWASYLGRMPVIWHRGQLQQRLYYDHPKGEIEFEEGEELAGSFVEAVGKDC